MRARQVAITEFLKLRRSAVVASTFAAYAFMAAVAGFFMWIMLHPDSGQALGLVGQKANFAFGGMKPDWETFMTFIVEMGGVGGGVLAAVVVTFVFGREYAEGTAKNLLALPEPRYGFVLAKIGVSALWFLALNIWLLPASWAAGSLAGLEGFSWIIMVRGALQLAALSAMNLACAMLVAWVAVASRGYFAPLGFMIFTVMLGSVFGRTGWAPWVPWCVVGIYSGAAGPGIELPVGSYLVVLGTFLLGTALTIRHEAAADNAQ